MTSPAGPENLIATSLPSGAQPPAYEPPARGVDFRHLWHTVLEKIWILVLCTLAGLFIALGYIARTPKIYQGHVLLEVDVAESSVVGNEDMPNRVRSMFLASQEAMRTIEQNLLNRSLMARVIRSENLADDGGQYLLGGGKASVAKAPPKPSVDVTPGEREPAFSPMEEALGGALSSMVKPVIRRGTRLIDLYVINRDPALSQRLADAVGREYIRASIERRASGTQETLRFLMEEEERLKANLQKSEAAVAEYKAKTPDALQLGGGTAATGSQTGAGSGSSGGRGGLVEDKLQELSTKLTTAKAERLRLEGELEQIEKAGENIDELLAVPSIVNAPNVADRRRELAQVQAAVATLSQRYKEKHPRMLAAKAALAEVQASLRRAVLEQPAVLRNAIQQAKTSESNLQSAASEQEKAAIALNRAAIGYQELARQAETDRALYESVLRQIKSTDLTKGVKTNAVSVIEHSPTPSGPISPNPPKAIALGLLGGIAAALAFIFGMNALDRSIKTVDQAESRLGLPVLTAIPEVKAGESPGPAQLKRDSAESGSANYRLVAEAPEGPAAEAFRNLRASLSLLGPESERRIFLFTSAVPSEGKSFSSANYALSLAQQGHRVLLIDGDLRRPSLHKIFVRNQPDAEAKGIVDFLVGDATLDQVVSIVEARDVDVLGTAEHTDRLVTTTGGQLSLLAGGRRAPNPAELLSGHTFRELIAKAAATYDRIVIDSAPVLAVSDTLLMTAFAQTVCLVVRASKTPRNAVQRALFLLSGSGTKPAGVLLNRLPRERGRGYYYYYASHGYGAGEGSYGSYGSYGTGTYGAPGKKKKG